jgi:alanyl-tRNA synthetase
MDARELRQKYIDFFVSKGHKVIKSSSLIPENDPTVLFTTAGMHPLVPFLMGEKHPLGMRLVNYQKCVRTGDIDEVGDDTHLTFFEMLGNWSLGDYFKEDAIKWSFEFLTGKEWLNISPNKLAISVFAGEEGIPKDEEAAKIWMDLGIPKERIAYLDREENWWGPAGETGPCGPDSEMFYWVGDEEAPEVFDPEDKRWVEIWNDVFMQYNKVKVEGTDDFKYVELKEKNIDTGMGLERVVTVLNGEKSVYDTEIFARILEKIRELAADTNKRSERIIADHIRAATFMAGDGAIPSNLDQGYVMRRLLRRAIREGKKIGIEKAFTHEIVQVIINQFGPVYEELVQKQDDILRVISAEEERFMNTLQQGLREFEKISNNIAQHGGKKLSGRLAFKLYDTYGFPIEMTVDLAREHDLEVNLAEFEEAFKKHQELSRKGAEKKFKGGLADHTDLTTKLHTATHLLHQALRTVLGDHVEQKGSNITAERLRFDFTHPEKMTPEQKEEVEKLVNSKIQAALPVSMEEMTVEEAKKEGAIGLFAEKYGERVKVYNIDGFSNEICGGPHVGNTSELGVFKIKKEESSSAGIRRIKATLG